MVEKNRVSLQTEDLCKMEKHQEAGKKYTNPGSHPPNPLWKADLWYPSGDQGGSLDVGFFEKTR